ncbi:transcriptional regulator, DeoR family [Coriobacterium glomerans PW2]|uniref:Transcriptional regulator, DeoR family n=1 Tax=Coriobacterium glomerans (strain ATCC 49209 / DSM 20642 / JCM 10262 / PW2) TaxID=700015 RepID=F2N7U9_CORGP|nr:DeoR/GlpR family DNA-binding transcription regulator [Coriobacterium glomerans]AEB07058.1 transcriptional regulator, DeoR family [Coriobacterium glomerans PW2]
MNNSTGTPSCNDLNLFAEERRNRILELLASESRVLVGDLSMRFGVSPATLRNDLRDLDAAGLLRRTHGGAVVREAVAVEQPADTAFAEHQEAKIAIGARAAQLVRDGETIFCDSGSTTFEFVRALASRRGITLITNDYAIASEAERLLPDCSINLLGGSVRNGFHYTTGSSAIDALMRFSAPLAFLAASAFSFERGFTVHTTDLSNFKRRMIERSERCVMLMDSSKIGTFTTVTFAELSDVSELVTDGRISSSDRLRFESCGESPIITIA